MRAIRPLLLLTASLIPVAALDAQGIIAQSSGLTNPDHLIDFGAGLYPNFTNITNQFAGITVTHARYYTTGTSNNLVGGFLTNDFSSGPTTLRIQFASPITDLTFVYHQVGTGSPSVFRAMLGTSTVFSFSNTSNQTQPNNYFGFTGITFDELQLDFVADFNVDTLAYNDAGAHCTIRNGSGINPVGYTFSTNPVLGQNWQCAIASTPNTITSFIAFAPGGPLAGLPLFNGELLVQPTPSPVLVQGMGPFSIAIPSSSSWNGFQISTQAVRFDVVGPTMQFVLLNAIDLVLGT